MNTYCKTGWANPVGAIAFQNKPQTLALEIFFRRKPFSWKPFLSKQFWSIRVFWGRLSSESYILNTIVNSYVFYKFKCNGFSYISHFTKSSKNDLLEIVTILKVNFQDLLLYLSCWELEYKLTSSLWTTPLTSSCDLPRQRLLACHIHFFKNC